MLDSFVSLIEFDEIETPDGKVVSLMNAWDHWLFSISGEGMPPIRWITNQGPFQDGETALDFRLQPRILQYSIRWDKSCNRADYWEQRRALIDCLRPNRSPVVGSRFAPLKLRKWLPPGTDGPESLYLNAVIDSGPQFRVRSLDRWDEWGFNEVLRFIAHDPVWIDSEQKSQSTVFVQAQELKFPITFDDDNIIFGGGAIDQDLNCTTLGTWQVYPMIILTGPISDPTITNRTTGETIELEYSIPAGRVVTIDLAYGQKTVTDDLGTNLIGSITPDSELADFHLAPDPEAAGGLNIINVLASGLEGASLFEIVWQDRYIGI